MHEDNYNNSNYYYWKDYESRKWVGEEGCTTTYKSFRSVEVVDKLLIIIRQYNII